MREIRTYGSEGGGTGTQPVLPTPISVPEVWRLRLQRRPNRHLTALSPVVGADAPAAFKNALPKAPAVVLLPGFLLSAAGGLAGFASEVKPKGLSESSSLSFFDALGSAALGSAALEASPGDAAGAPAAGAPGPGIPGAVGALGPAAPGAAPGGPGVGAAGAALGGAGAPGGGPPGAAPPESFFPQPQTPNSNASPNAVATIALMEFLRSLSGWRVNGE